LDNLSNQIDSELLNLKQMNQLASELNNLEKNLDSCIDLVSDSAMNPSLKNRLEEMRIDNHRSFKESSIDLEDRIELSKQNLYELSIRKSDEEEKEKEEDEEEEKDR
jgi:hypothetical protein